MRLFSICAGLVGVPGAVPHDRALAGEGHHVFAVRAMAALIACKRLADGNPMGVEAFPARKINGEQNRHEAHPGRVGEKSI